MTPRHHCPSFVRPIGILALAMGLTLSWTSHPSQRAAAEPTSVTLTASADTYSSFRETAQPHGGMKLAYATRGSENRAYLKFDTAGVVPTGKTVTSLTLRLHVLQNLQPSGVRVYPAPSHWREDRLTLTNVPGHWDARASWGVHAPAGGWVDIPLSVNGTLDLAGPSSFEVRNVLPNSSFAFSTKEAGKGAQLVIGWGAKAAATLNVAQGAVVAGAIGRAARVEPTTASGRAFDLPSANPQGRKVFAHYFTPYPVSLDNLAPDKDYYAVHYLDPRGENGKFAAIGGLLRDRPLGRAPRTGNYELADLRSQVDAAKQAGIDGFTVDILDIDKDNWRRAMLAMDAAAAEGDFSIVPMPDMTSIGWLNPHQMADVVAKMAAKPAVERLDDGRVLLSPFKAEAKNPDYWRSVIAALEARGVRVAFLPTFVDWPADAQGFAKISHGFSMWGGRSPANAHPEFAQRTRRLGLKWMQAVAVQDERPVGGVYDEAMNLATLRTTWQQAISSKAEYVQLTTWNDFSEGSAFAPSVGHGWAFLDASAYRLAQYKSGTAPALKRDALVVTHRKQRASAQPTMAGQRLMRLRENSSPAVDQVEVTSYLTAPGQVQVTVGVKHYVWNAPAGEHAHVVPLTEGGVSASVQRNGATTTSVVSPFTVTSSPLTQDLQYVAVSSLR